MPVSAVSVGGICWVALGEGSEGERLLYFSQESQSWKLFTLSARSVFCTSLSGERKADQCLAEAEWD